jgi:hypothetical protein
MKTFSKNFRIRMQVLMGLVAMFAVTAMAIIQPEFLMAGSAALAIIPIWGYVKDKTFKELTGEEVGELAAEDQVKYFNELNIHRADKMNQLKVDMKKEATIELTESIKALRDEINDSNVEQMKALQKSLEIQGLALNKLMTDGKVPSQKTIEEQLFAIKDDLKNATDKTVTIKTDVTSSSLTSSAFAADIPGVGQLAHLATKLLGLFAKGSIADGQGGVVRYVDQTAVTRSAAFVAEAGVKPESAITWAVYTVPLETIADTIPVTNQALSNIPFIASEIRNFLLANLAIKIDSSLWSGTGSAPQIFGIYTKATAWTAVASGMTDANIYDIISKMKTNIEAASNYVCNYVLLNPNDVTDYMTLKKDSTNNYILPPFVRYEGGKMYVHNMEVIATSAVTADTMLVGDFSKAVVYTHGGVKIDIGMIDKQFVENMVTIRAEQELGLVVRTVHVNAFNKETGIAAAIVTLNT